MFKKIILSGLLSLGLSGAVSAQTYWLNMVAAESQLSIPTASEESCTTAMYSYAKSNLRGSISCDVMPLPENQGANS